MKIIGKVKHMDFLNDILTITISNLDEIGEDKVVIVKEKKNIKRLLKQYNSIVDKFIKYPYEYKEFVICLTTKE